MTKWVGYPTTHISSGCVDGESVLHRVSSLRVVQCARLSRMLQHQHILKIHMRHFAAALSNALQKKGVPTRIKSRDRQYYNQLAVSCRGNVSTNDQG